MGVNDKVLELARLLRWGSTYDELRTVCRLAGVGRRGAVARAIRELRECGLINRAVGTGWSCREVSRG